MKKVITVLISLLMILSLAACGNSASQTGQPSTEEKPMESTADNVGSVESGTSVENTEAAESSRKKQRLQKIRIFRKSRKNREQRCWWLIFPLPIQRKG